MTQVSQILGLQLSGGGASDITRVQPGTNISTGGTQSIPSVNLDADIWLNTITAVTISASTYQGLPVEVHTAVQSGLNIVTGGTQLAPTVSLSGNVTVQGFTATTLSATTYQGLPTSATDQTAVQGGTNISTGGTQSTPSVNLDSNIWLNTITAVTISATTYQGLPVEVHTAVQSGLNIVTGGTQLAPTLSLSGNVTVQGLTATTLSATTYQGLPAGLTENTAVQAGSNISTGGTQLVPTIKLDSNIWLSTITAVTISATTYQGLPVETHTAVQGGTNISTGGTQLAPSVKLDPNIWLNTITAVTISATTYQGLPVEVHTAVQSGLNIVTGGTQLAPTVSLSGNVTVQGFTATTISATTYQGLVSSIFSAGTGEGSAFRIDSLNSASGPGSFAVGSGNTSSGELTATIGGSGNTASVSGSAIIAAFNSVASGKGSLIAGGSDNATGGKWSVIAGGVFNSIPGPSNSFIGGGSTLSITSGGNSAIIAGSNSIIKTSISNTVILGGTFITGVSSSYVYVPSLNIDTTPTNDDALSQVLVRDSSTGNIRYRTAESIATGGTLPFQEIIYSGVADHITFDIDVSMSAKVTLTANTTLLIVNAVDGAYGTLRIIQDSTGGWTITLPTGSIVANGGGGSITLTSNASATDVVSFVKDGTDTMWNAGFDYT